MHGQVFVKHILLRVPTIVGRPALPFTCEKISLPCTISLPGRDVGIPIPGINILGIDIPGSSGAVSVRSLGGFFAELRADALQVDRPSSIVAGGIRGSFSIVVIRGRFGFGMVSMND